MQPRQIRLYESHRDNDPSPVEVTWADLALALSESRETPCTPCSDPKNCWGKYGPAWSPVALHDTCQLGLACRDPRHQTDPNHPPRRASENVREVTFAVFDLDHLDEAGLGDLAQRIEPLRYVLHTTHSHRPPADQALRLVVDLTRPVPAADWRRFLAAAISHLGLPADPSCKDLARLYFLPSHAAGFDHFFAEGTGAPLDVDEILARVPFARLPAPLPAALPADEPVDEAPDGGQVALPDLLKDLKALRRTYKSKKDTERHDLCDRILTGAPLAQTGARDTTVHQAASMLGTVLPAGTPSSAAVEVLRRSIGAMPTEPEGLDHWLAKAQDSYERSMARRIENDRRRDEINARLGASMRALARPSGAAAGARPSEGATPAASTEGESSDVEEWHKQLIFRPVKDANETPKLLPCGHNAALILTHDATWKNALRWNEVSKAIEVVGGPLPETDRHLSVLARAVSDYLLSVYGMGLDEGTIKSCLLLVARRNTYDPLRDHLLALRWDGMPRCDDFLEKYCHVQTKDSTGDDITRHVRTISAKWFISCVARALDPGCKVDTVLVLEGFNGFRKSGVFEVLGGAFYTPSQQNLADKDTRMLAACSWIIELAELDAVRKSDREATNGFLSTRRDKFRPPYGAAIEEFPRRAVFVGTTEDEDWLQSWKGIRRWWPVKISQKIDLDKVMADRDQLWAEAVFRYLAGEKWYLDDVDSEHAQAIAHDRVRRSGVVDVVAAWWHALTLDKRPPIVRTMDAAVAALHLTVDKITRNIEMDVGEALRELGFSRERRLVNGVRTYVYVATDALRSAPVTKIGPSGVALSIAVSRPGGTK